MTIMKRGQNKAGEPPNLGVCCELYKVMLKIRQAELKIAEIYPSDKIQSPVHLSIGQEAVAAGVCLALRKIDRLYGTYRSHGIYIGKGGSLDKMFAELYAKDTGCARGRGGSMHLVAPEVGLIGCSAIVASTIPVATGDALASARLGRKWVSVSFFGDGAVDEGVFYESLNFAELKHLPIVYVLENNELAVHSNLAERHRHTDLYKYGEPFGIKGSRHDGNDVFTVYSATRSAVEKVRVGGPPVLLEFMTYRMREHVGSGEDHKEAYRDKKKLAAAIKSDPLLRAKKVLRKKFKVPEKEFARWEDEINREVDWAVEFAEKSPFPTPAQLYQGVFKKAGTAP